MKTHKEAIDELQVLYYTQLLREQTLKADLQQKMLDNYDRLLATTLKNNGTKLPDFS